MDRIEKNGWAYESNPVDGHILTHEFDGQTTTQWNIIYNGHILDAGWYLTVSHEYAYGHFTKSEPTKISEKRAKETIEHWSKLEEWA